MAICGTSGRRESPDLRLHVHQPRQYRCSRDLVERHAIDRDHLDQHRTKPCKACAMHSHPARVLRGCWYGAVADSAAVPICWAMARNTNRRTTSPATMPLLHKVCRRQPSKTQGIHNHPRHYSLRPPPTNGTTSNRSRCPAMD